MVDDKPSDDMDEAGRLCWLWSHSRSEDVLSSELMKLLFFEAFLLHDGRRDDGLTARYGLCGIDKEDMYDGRPFRDVVVC